ncbi:63 kDa sperm flagellar membrane protein-like [Anneissia japonica]|uniref:63 kDa sperm flagellar membrane protein-like n=1 Tax=Anneissia japonica TaxID=1529436 RepID=UPI0014258ACA|nr:63 kDa sperm flagellar membrane protein-like [Anneissia japonica]
MYDDIMNSPGSNSTGVMVECPASMANPSCNSGFKMNANGDGWVIRKECMEYDECYDRFYGNTLDPVGSACFDDSPVGNTMCISCCLEDGCNSDYKYSWYVMPNSNNWNPEVDTGYPATTTAAPTLPGGGGGGGGDGENGAAHHTMVVTMSLLFTILPCLV